MCLPNSAAIDLIDGDAVEETLARLRVAIRTGEPHRAPPVTFVGILVPQALNDAEVGFVPGQRLQAGGEFVVGAGFGDVGIPRIFGHAPAEAEEDDPLGRCDRRGGERRAAKSERLQERQRDERRARLEKSTACGVVGHGNKTPYCYFV